jgi:hypothetical protein
MSARWIVPNLDLSTVSTTSTYARSEQVYFDNGDIVLVAEGVAFKVYLGLLRIYSKMFRDMTRGVPLGVGTYDRCHVLNLPDKADDVSKTLELAYGIS